MPSSELLSENARSAKLRTCEDKIRSACRRGLAEVRTIAKELIVIEDDDLWQAADKPSFRQYVIEVLGLDFRSAQRWMDVQRTMTVLEQSGVPQLPDNINQVTELTKLPSDTARAAAWTAAVNLAEHDDLDLTTDLVRRAVSAALGKRSGRPKPIKGDNGHALDIGVAEDEEEGEEEVEVEDEEGETAAISLTEEGEEALARIRSLCGESTYKAIANGTVDISEPAIIKWASQTDETVKNMAYYVIDQRWSLNKALAFDHQYLNDETTLKSLINLARSRNGYTFDYEEFTITIKRS